MNPVLTIILSFAVIGALVDFLFNGVVMTLLFHSIFTETWMFLYLPLFATVIATLSNYVLKTKWRHLNTQAVIAFVCGALVGHLFLIGLHRSRTYSMTVVSDSPALLLRSPDWPQILFVQTKKIGSEQLQAFNKEKIPVTLDFVLNYGCIREVSLSTIAGIDIKHDPQSAWIWRIDPNATTSEIKGPDMEDLKFPWCQHLVEFKGMENGPAVKRPWDELLLKYDQKTKGSSSF